MYICLNIGYRSIRLLYNSWSCLYGPRPWHTFKLKVKIFAFYQKLNTSFFDLCELPTIIRNYKRYFVPKIKF